MASAEEPTPQQQQSTHLLYVLKGERNSELILSHLQQGKCDSISVVDVATLSTVDLPSFLKGVPTLWMSTGDIVTGTHAFKLIEEVSKNEKHAAPVEPPPPPSYTHGQDKFMDGNEDNTHAIVTSEKTKPVREFSRDDFKRKH